MAKKRRKKSPSRVKYEKGHPVISARVDRELYEALEAMKEAEGLSNADLLKIAADKLEVKIRSEEKIKLQGFDEGYEQAAKTAEELYMVTYPCSVCGETIIVETKEEKKAIAKYMVEHGWGHAKCIERRYGS